MVCSSLCVLAGCIKEEDNSISEYANRTVLVYMAADNDLYINARRNINAMSEALVPQEGNLLVYLDAPQGTHPAMPCLLRIAQGKVDTLKHYEECNSASGVCLQQVLSDVQDLSPANSYGLVLWSHGTGWLPPKYDFRATASTNSTTSVHPAAFGRDQGEEMDIKELAQALPSGLDFILFDACLMASVEVCYELRHKTEIIIASPTEILSSGMPYGAITPLLFLKEAAHDQIAKEYMLAYRNKDIEILQSATIAVIHTNELELLARLMAQTPRQEWRRSMVVDSCQRFDFFATPVFYDLKDCLRLQYYPEHFAPIARQLEAAVPFADHTAQFLGKAIKHCCGLSTHLPDTSQQLLYEAYCELEWYKDTQASIR